jgi:hypothetical protein
MNPILLAHAPRWARKIRRLHNGALLAEWNRPAPRQHHDPVTAPELQGCCSAQLLSEASFISFDAH